MPYVVRSEAAKAKQIRFAIDQMYSTRTFGWLAVKKCPSSSRLSWVLDFASLCSIYGGDLALRGSYQNEQKIARPAAIRLSIPSREGRRWTGGNRQEVPTSRTAKESMKMFPLTGSAMSLASAPACTQRWYAGTLAEGARARDSVPKQSRVECIRENGIRLKTLFRVPSAWIQMRYVMSTYGWNYHSKWMSCLEEKNKDCICSIRF